MRRTDFYELTVALWPRAVAAGLQPVETKGFERGDQYYREHRFFFDYPPSREDWWELCRQTVWMQCFEDRREIIDSNPWPLVVPGKKCCDVELLDSQGRRIGRIAVDRRDCMRNRCHNIPHIGVNVWDRIVRGLKGQARDDAYSWVVSNEHYIAEEAMKASHGNGVTDALLVKVGKQLAGRFGKKHK